jgi:hypothetical protein
LDQEGKLDTQDIRDIPAHDPVPTHPDDGGAAREPSQFEPRQLPSLDQFWRSVDG